MLGSAPIGALRALTLLCREPDLEVQAHAANAIAIASMHDGNNAAMGRMEGLVSVLVRLCRDTEDAEVQKHAAAALANVGYKESANQELIGRLGGVVALVEICRRTRCVDVLETASAALANLICRNDGNALRLGRARPQRDLVHAQAQLSADGELPPPLPRLRSAPRCAPVVVRGRCSVLGLDRSAQKSSLTTTSIYCASKIGRII